MAAKLVSLYAALTNGKCLRMWSVYLSGQFVAVPLRIFAAHHFTSNAHVLSCFSHIALCSISMHNVDELDYFYADSWSVVLECS